MRFLILTALLTLNSCEYPDIEIGQHDINIARRFIFETWGYNYLGERAPSLNQTVEVYPTCLIGCYQLDSATAYQLCPRPNGEDSIHVDTSYTIPYIQ